MKKVSQQQPSATNTSPEVHEELLQRILEMEPGCVYVFDLVERTYLFTNRSLREQLGYSSPELANMGSSVLERIIHPEDFPRVEEHLRRLQQSADAEPLEISYTVVTKTGERRMVHSTDVVFKRDAKRTVTQVLGVSHDITAWSETERVLRDSESMLRQIIEHSTNLFYSHTSEHVLTYVSPQCRQFFDCEPEEALRRWTEFATDNPINEKGFETTQRAIDTGIAQPPYELELRSVAGRILWVEVRESPVVVDGRTVAIVGSLSDITARKTAEQRLRMSEEYYRSLIENASDVVTVLDRRGLITFVSPSMERILGYRRGDLIGRNMVSFIHPEDQWKIIRSFAKGMREPGVPYRDIARFQHSNGSWRTFDSIGKAIAGREGDLVGIINSRDISERVEFEERLQQSEERYRSFFEDDLSGAYISTPDGTIIDCNPAFVRMFGFSSIEEAKGTRASELYKNPEERSRLLQHLRKEKKVEYHSFELLRRDGTTLYAVGNITASFNAVGQIEQMKGYLFDETKRRQLEGELVQAQKMESLGRLAGGIAHDFNNLLAIILGQAGLLSRDSTDEDRVRKGAQAIEKASHRGADLVKQLLTFARKTDVALGAVNVNASLKELMAFIRVTFPKTVNIRTSLEPALPRVSGDATQIYQVFLNLCVNANDAMPNGGTLTIATQAAKGTTVRATHPAARAESYVQVRISDTGTGMDGATLTRIYEPFFTTKEQGKGTGLGLSVAFGIIESHYGYIDVETTPEKGTTFIVSLPAAAGSSDADEQSTAEGTPSKGGQETILIIEDEEMLRNMLDLALDDKGYRRHLAVDGAEGIATFKKHSSEIDLVITDMGLPKVNGRQVVREIMTQKPSSRIIVMSGYLEPGVRSELLSLGVRAILQKPFVTDDLLRTVREVLDIRDP